MSEPQIDPAEIERLKSKVLYLCGVVDQQSSKLQALTETILQLSASVITLQGQGIEDPRIGFPDKWNGVAVWPDRLLATLERILECQPSTDLLKVALLTSLLSSHAQEWPTAVYNTTIFVVKNLGGLLFPPVVRWIWDFNFSTYLKGINPFAISFPTPAP